MLLWACRAIFRLCSIVLQQFWFCWLQARVGAVMTSTVILKVNCNHPLGSCHSIWGLQLSCCSLYIAISITHSPWCNSCSKFEICYWGCTSTELQFQLVFKMLSHSTHESCDRMCLVIECVCLLQKCHLKALQKTGHLSACHPSVP